MKIMPIISDLSAVFVVVAVAAHAGHSLAVLFCFPGNYSTCSSAVQVLSACVCACVCLVFVFLKPALQHC